jgi:hypothetical protein
MEKTPEEKRKEGEALLAAGRAKIAEAERDERAAMKSQPKATQPPFYPKPPKRTRFTATQICSKTSPVEAEAALKKLGQ